MSKYDFEVDLDIRSSTGMILSKIKPNSIILEFGCASGRMTKYLKSALNCQVYIVEYDKEAFDVAMQYAFDGVCDDILSLSWMKKFQGVKFDAILFVDVLEHLTQPNVALSKAAEMLKDSGKIYISIPNIAHNDIILKALNNHFDYMDLGILDDTHVHFWGYENIVPFANDNGLNVNSIEATYRPTGTTEQCGDKALKYSPILLNFLNERKYAEAYQFIIVLEKQLKEGKHNDIIINSSERSYITSHIYIDYGNDFNEKNIISFQSENITSGRYIVHYVLSDTAGIKRVRFDPVEQQGCIVQNFSARQAGRQLEYTYSDHLEISDGILMLGTDPMILIDVPSETKFEAITIDADFVILSDEYLDILREDCISKQTEINTLRSEVNGLNNQVGNLNAQYEEINGEAKNLRIQNERLNSAVNNLNAQYEKLNKENSNFSTQNIRMQSDLNAYVLLVNRKDELLIIKDSLLQEKEDHIKKLIDRVNYFENRRCIRICNKFWKVYWRIRLDLRRLVGKKDNNE